MTNSLNIFGDAGAGKAANPYESLGLTRNPFRVVDEDVRTGQVPFYTDYIRDEMARISQWIDDVHVRGQRGPLTLVGNIGVGKTAVVGHLAARLREYTGERIAVKSLMLSDAGYGKISVGAWLMAALEDLRFPWERKSPPDDPTILPLLWLLVRVKHDSGTGRIGRVIASIVGKEENEQEESLRHLTTWLRRGALTDAQARRLGLGRRIDWEGELIPVFAELLRLAGDAKILKTFFFFVDQVEDLFTPAISPMRRSRVLTDLRVLIDHVSAGAPIGLLIAATPDFVTQNVARNYPALASRIAQRRIDLPFLERRFADKFTETWLKSALLESSGVDPTKLSAELAEAAWSAMRNQSELQQPGDKAVQRLFLSALANEVDRRARDGR